MAAIAMSKTVDRTIDEIDAAMRTLRDSLRGIPFRSGGFKNSHDNLARQMAHLTVLLDAARAAYRN
jgi:hypothetical protein